MNYKTISGSVNNKTLTSQAIPIRPVVRAKETLILDGHWSVVAKKPGEEKLRQELGIKSVVTAPGVVL